MTRKKEIKERNNAITAFIYRNLSRTDRELILNADNNGSNDQLSSSCDCRYYSAHFPLRQ